MKGLIFEAPTLLADAATNRSDVACFIGYTGLREAGTPPELARWLRREGWWATDRATAAQTGEPSLYDLPLPIDNWEQFDRLFAWDRRAYGEVGTVGASYLGAAVRSFFAQGGRKCYVISLGEPVALDADRAARDAMLGALVPHSGGGRSRRGDWHGLHHLLGLPEVSFVALPDLAELACGHRAAAPSPIEVPPVEPGFVECSEPVAAAQEDRAVVHLAAPRCTDAGYGHWHSALRRALQWIAIHRRDTQLLAALPLPAPEGSAAPGLLRYLHAQGWLTDRVTVEPSIASAFLQLVFPWLRMSYAGDLPAALEPPEGVVAGLLARNALTRGSFRSATALTAADVLDREPRLERPQLFGLDPQAPPRASPAAPLIDRVSVLGPTPDGVRLLSDVTTSNERSHRQGGVNRSIALVLRAARDIGEEYAFEASGERLWQRVRERLEDVLAAMLGLGALSGKRPRDAYQVRCDRSTMTQQDIDRGRVIVQVSIRPAASIETMRIQLTIADGGRAGLSVVGLEAA